MEYDLIIAGGGINGAALARLAAFQGLKVALFESGDFGQGASTNTSKLLHGGLRYLETYAFSLVRDATRERAQLLGIAPHLVEARRFLFPRTSLGRHGRAGIKAGLTLYDFLAGKLRIQSHRWVSAGELTKLEPHFLPQEACGAYEYSDCVMDDARLVLENLVDARALGAHIHNYHSFLGVVSGGEGWTEVKVLDRISGQESRYRTKSVALALGPWTDKVAKTAFPLSVPQVRLSQGIHLIVRGLPSSACFILPVPNTRRYFFVVPWKETHLIGTTETEVGDYPPDSMQPQDQEIAELLRLTEIYFPGQKPDVICTITGLRPLARAVSGSTITLSREHEFHKLQDGVFSAVGGKYTTHRTLAEQYLKFILGDGKKAKDIKARLLPGAWMNAGARATLEIKLRTFSFVDDKLRVTWMRRYGLRALELAEFTQNLSGGSERLPGEVPILMAEVHFAYEREWARTPEDFYRRRTDVYFTWDGGLASLSRVEAFFLTKQPLLGAQLGQDADYRNFLIRNRHRAGG